MLLVDEPRGLCWIVGKKAPTRDGPTWSGRFARLPNQRAAFRDDGLGLDREDLGCLPGTGWSLFGPWRSLELQGKRDEARLIRSLPSGG